ncbi:MAG: hypothetical protein MJK18_03100 [Bdellovibrionales bacterium]|nr:hypothetical protein [Bdellovibrionales bacterium]
MKRHFIIFASVLFLISIAQAETSKKMTPTQSVQKIKNFKTQDSLFKAFAKNLTEDQFAEFQELSKEAKVNGKNKLSIEMTGKNRFEFQSNEYIFSHSGKHLRFNKKNFSLDAKKSIYWNYQNILSKTKSENAFHILTLLYFVKFNS